MMPAIRKYVLAAATAMICGVAMAQYGNKALFERAVDRLNCEAVNWSMESVKNSKFKERCPCEDEPGYEQVKACIGVADVTKTLALFEDIEQVKKDFKDAWTKEEAVQYLTSTVFNDSIKHGPLYAFVSRTAKEDREDRKDKPRREHARFHEITSKVADILAGWAEAPPAVEERPEVPSTGPAPVKETGFGLLALFLVWLASVLASVGITLFLPWLRKGDAKRNEVTNDIKNYVKKKIEEKSHEWSAPPSMHRERNLGKNHDQLADQIKKLEEEIQKLRERIDVLLPNTSPVTPVPPPTAPPPSVDYFHSAPDTEGVFGEAATAYNERKHVFKLTKQGDGTASFVIHQHQQAVGLALARHEVYIRPVCDASNAYDPNARRITTEAPGKAKFEGGKWKMTSKARIRYEH